MIEIVIIAILAGIVFGGGIVLCVLMPGEPCTREELEWWLER